MDGKGRRGNNVMIERFWRSIKYEDIYPKSYKNLKLLTQGIVAYALRYNTIRPHESLNDKTPDEIYRGEMKIAAWKALPLPCGEEGELMELQR